MLKLADAAWAAGPRDNEGAAAQKELLLWGWISFGALAVAGVFALLLAVSRVPGFGAVFPADFFYKGLVIHVVFSLVVWLLANLGFHMSAAAYDLAEGAPRAAALGRIGQVLALASFPLLFVPAFLPGAQPELTNYIPLIAHPLYDLGLLLLAAGVLAPALRLFANLRGTIFALPPETFGAVAMAFTAVLALATFAIAAVALSRHGDLVNSREPLNWGGGHLLQFAYAALLLTNWTLLSGRIFGAELFDDEAIRFALMLLALFTVPSLGFYFAYDPFSAELHDSYRFLQYGIGFPVLLAAAALFSGPLRTGALKDWSWRDPGLVALAASVGLFAVGGAMGAAISGSDTRTPAHYHAVITAVSLSCMGVLLTYGFERAGRAAAAAKYATPLLLLYGGGQLAASLGMFVAGGYGAQRKTPEAVDHLTHVAAAGMAAHGMGAVLAVIGGAGVVVLALRALSRPARAFSVRSRAPD